MREHQHHRILYKDDELRISDLRCRRFGCSRQFWEETCEDHELVFLRCGMYVRHVGDREMVGDANHVQFFHRGEPNQTTHPLPGGDDSTVIALSDERLLDFLAAFDPWVRERPEQPFPVHQCLFSSRSFELHNELLRQVRDGAGALAVHETVLALLESVMGTIQDGSRRPSPPAGRAAATHRELAEGVKILLNEQMAEGPTLTQLASALHTSPYHLARVFQRQCGVTVHRYLTQLRLRSALKQLAEGEEDLSGLAHRLGFSDHSHFTNAFRREFTLPPSHFRLLV